MIARNYMMEARTARLRSQENDDSALRKALKDGVIFIEIPFEWHIAQSKSGDVQFPSYGWVKRKDLACKIDGKLYPWYMKRGEDEFYINQDCIRNKS